MTENENIELAIQRLIEKYKNKKSELIECLQLVQNEFGYIPEKSISVISKTLNIPQSDVYSVISFYSQFTLRAKAKYTIEICLGTACYVLGADKILKVLENKLNIKLGEKSSDNKYEIVQSRCLGCCSMAPVVKINDKIYGNLNESKILEILSALN